MLDSPNFTTILISFIPLICARTSTIKRVMSNADCITILAQALSDNPHKNVLMKNALQAAQPSDHSVLNLGSPKDAADSTHSTSSKSSRSSDLQPVNDPFLVDNIFKSPKKRRRGLLSWSAVPSDYTLHGNRTISMSRELSRHSRVKQRRQSILGTKSRQPSLRRRQTSRSSSKEHARSASDSDWSYRWVAEISRLDAAAELLTDARTVRGVVAGTAPMQKGAVARRFSLHTKRPCRRVTAPSPRRCRRCRTRVRRPPARCVGCRAPRRISLSAHCA
ncbi:hypothetical protein DL89DRAFT_59942 [Linderina pennispora]|uniref:Uncharacterized protein n=1 Tax=Linderina pennispora TaxID=61395 RepID=A0A1Y1VZX9_9FUNG|nr:uncharacterized protein DL89DRAFT_59942 [Linderina pennispora]ORX66802.1 hypothetical protein DL89DRAFT_59942 [Linderina pennispora]